MLYYKSKNNSPPRIGLWRQIAQRRAESVCHTDALVNLLAICRAGHGQPVLLRVGSSGGTGCVRAS
jgi:hypothetical protein